MATQADIVASYDFMDEILRLSLGPYPEITCALFEGDQRRSLERAQDAKHEFIFDRLRCTRGTRLLDIGCGWGPLLHAAANRGMESVGVTLSPKQVASCKRRALNVLEMDWRDLAAGGLGPFDAIASVEAIEHFATVRDAGTGKQLKIYTDFFASCAEILGKGQRLFLQCSLWGPNAPPPSAISLRAPHESPQYRIAVLMRIWPNAWPPNDVEQLIEAASPEFDLVESINGRLDYIQTTEAWDVVWRPSPRKILAALKILPALIVDRDMRYRLEAWRRAYTTRCYEQLVLDHERMVFERR